MELKLVGSDKFRYTKKEIEKMEELGIYLDGVTTEKQLSEELVRFIETISEYPEGQRVLIKLYEAMKENDPEGFEKSEEEYRKLHPEDYLEIIDGGLRKTSDEV